MKRITKILITATVLAPTLSFASAPLRCQREVTFAIQKSTMFNMVEHVRSKDGINYVVIFRTASGDAEEASMAVVKADPKDCSIKKTSYIQGAH